MIKHLPLAWQRIRRSPYQALAAVSIMTMSLFLGSVFFLLAAGSQAVLTYFETRPQVNAFFKSDLVPTPQAVDLIKTNLQATNLVADVKYISKEEALKLYKELNKSDPLLLEAVTANMLPASIEVSAKNPADLKPIAELLKVQPDIDDVRFAEDIVSQLAKWTSSVRLIGFSLVGSHLIITFIIILLIISIKVANRRDEIVLHELLGATSGYISTPFVWEGIIYGVTGAFIAWGVSYLILLYSTPFLAGFLAGIPILPVSLWFMFSLLGGELLLGAVIGAVGGFLAVRRFLKV
ncbi:MAG: Cell division protein [Candidatus Amesbacteria bacterium GW2011_GWB1_47_26]|uniref:Cell division protein FtsX n=1 Tax=Candidatus Amesbacteria bacterium GW2011_GWC2_45_19 TaxID=1618366 RepID=A0A0G1Q463_9BACT|nr:MAG: Cell division protein [Candidatus Amesbacteria bacterium GW2011_GWC2_45_19]KKU38162.1 MAG: Cell division protein [Candidatus Amesbacteria bacterium GW2011_GWA1_46_35]KKU69567.1 MAG: Cell division protein [Microgenomates group bacterium GW2011_GWC1_47_20]KKU74430.1 MAG: Cell division protein [Candidatus Amesbacteria bacterium GW2011_GWB1_47_26]